MGGKMEATTEMTREFIDTFNSLNKIPYSSIIGPRDTDRVRRAIAAALAAAPGGHGERG